MRSSICVYHSRDLDGWMSAAIMKHELPEVELIGWDYGDPIPKLNAHDVYLVDISFPPDVMVDMWATKNLIWIDHHVSAIKDSVLNKYDEMDGLRDSKFAACELTWRWFYPPDEKGEIFIPSMFKPIPEAVRLLGRYDCFGHKGTEEEGRVFAFQYAARALAENPEEAEQFLDMSDTEISNTVDRGEAILKYLSVEAKQLYESLSFPFILNGLKGIAINRTRFNPTSYGIDYSEYDFCACFAYDGEKWHWSLYNDGDTDVSVIAKSFGGGGHAGAAGFITDDLSLINYETLIEK